MASMYHRLPDDVRAEVKKHLEQRVLGVALERLSDAPAMWRIFFPDLPMPLLTRTICKLITSARTREGRIVLIRDTSPDLTDHLQRHEELAYNDSQKWYVPLGVHASERAILRVIAVVRDFVLRRAPLVDVLVACDPIQNGGWVGSIVVAPPIHGHTVQRGTRA